MHSGAFQFKSFVQHGVDPRTGQYTVSLAIPELRNNNLAGPVLPLSIAFSPLNARDVGFGRGWTINLTSYDPQARYLSLGSGENFTVTGSGNQPGIKEKKLDNFHFHEDGDKHFRVVHRSGLVEVLRTGGSGVNPRALPERVYAPDGRFITLTYVPFAGDRRLESITDADGELLRVVRNDMRQEIELLFYPEKGEGGQALSRFVMKMDGNERVTRVMLPTEDQACWKFEYEEVRGIFCLSEVWTPTGAHETIKHNDTGHAFPGGELDALPRVTLHRVDPHQNQPPIEVHYEYSDKNFLGNGVLTSWTDNGFDNLYQTSDHTFRYSSTAKLMEGQTVVRAVERFYNRFHLMTEEVTTQGKCRKRTVTRYYADHPDYVNLHFDQQPAQCQLPMFTETHWELIGDATKKRMDVSETYFDDWGNLTEQRNPDGTREVLDYYPAAGGPGCPQDPEGFVRQLRSRTVYPAPSEHGDAPVLVTEYGYTELPVIPWEYGSSCVVEDWQVMAVQDGAQMRRLDTTYFDDPGDSLRFGRTRQVEETINQKVSTTKFEYNIETPTRLLRPALQVVETLTGFDDTTQTAIEYSDLCTGQAALETALDGVVTLRVHDALNRLVSETLAPGTEYAATVTYEHHLVGEAGTGTAWQQITDADGVVTRTQFDGMARVVSTSRQDTEKEESGGADHAPADALRPTYRACYNALDQMVTETQFDWFGAEDREFTTHNTFDDWGEPYGTTRPDGVTEVTEKSPFGLRGPMERRWLESAETPPAISNLEELQYNRFGSVDSTVKLDGKVPRFTFNQFFDGLGQCVKSQELFDDQERITTYTFDAWRRMSTMTLPDGDTVRRVFAQHSSEDLPVEMLVKPKDQGKPEVSIGAQAYDGLDRLTSRTIGGRHETYTYTGGATQASTRATPAGAEIEIEYERALGDTPSLVTSPDETARYTYDPISGAIATAGNEQGERRYEYTPTGELALESFTPPGGGAMQSSRYLTSLRGLALQRNDHVPGSRFRLTTQYRYDEGGRLEYTSLGLLSAGIEYDAFSRPKITTNRNLATGQTVTGERTYDSHGRETKRDLSTGTQTFSVAHTWRGDDQLVQRVLSVDGHVLLDEGFTYDLRGRLMRHTCSGSQLPQDRHGNRITVQVFTYDALSNVHRCTTTFDDNSYDIALHTYDAADPCQLTGIQHSHASYTEQETFEYDADGNLLNDHQGYALHYDSLGRLLALSQGNEETRYFYDGHGELLGTAHGTAPMTPRFQTGFQYHHQGGPDTTYALHANGELIGLGSTAGAGSAQLLLTNAIGTVIGKVKEDEVATTAYTAYGEADTVLAELLGYNGETREPGGWYLLGRGYRAYNPALRRFNAPDSICPFEGGGLNPYAYCEGNPIRFHDPSGHHVRALPEYYYPPPPPKPVPQPKQGGGWLKWLGVGVSAVFLAVSVASAPFSLGLTAPLMIKSLVGIGIQLAGLALGVVATVSEDPTLQMVGMIGSMVLGMYGGHVMGKAAAKAAPLLKQQKLAKAGLYDSLADVGFKISRPTVKTPAAPVAPGTGTLATASPSSAATRTASTTRLRTPESTFISIPKLTMAMVQNRFVSPRGAGALSDLGPSILFTSRAGVPQSPGLRGLQTV